MEDKGLERLSLEFKGAFSDSGELEGYASVTGIVDRDGEIVAKGAFADVSAFVQAGFFAVGHDWTGLPIGTVEDAREDDNGLYVRLAFHSTPEAQAARTVAMERLARGKSVGLSIGFRSLEDRWETVEGKSRRIIAKAEVYEVSLVPIPANPLANATSVKSMSLADEAEEVVILARRLAERARAVARLRREQGKSLSAERVEQIREAARLLTETAEEASPRPAPDPETIQRIGERLARLKRRIK